MAGSNAVMAYLSQPVEKHTLLPLRPPCRPERRLGRVEAIGHAAARAIHRRAPIRSPHRRAAELTVAPQAQAPWRLEVQNHLIRIDDKAEASSAQ